MEPSVQTRFSAEELREKNSVLKKELLSLSLEYMLACISHEYSKTLSNDGSPLESIHEFNELNKLGLSKILVYPFFVALSNGFSESLYNLFGPFKTFNFGPGSEPIYDVIRPNSKVDYPKLSYFEIDLDDNPSQLLIKNSSISNFQQLKKEILKTEISLDPSVNFKIFEIEGDDKEYAPVYKAIESGINELQVLSHNQFFKSTKAEILFRANNLKAFNKAFINGEVNTLTFAQLGSPRERSFYSQKLHS